MELRVYHVFIGTFDGRLNPTSRIVEDWKGLDFLNVLLSSNEFQTIGIPPFGVEHCRNEIGSRQQLESFELRFECRDE